MQDFPHFEMPIQLSVFLHNNNPSLFHRQGVADYTKDEVRLCKERTMHSTNDLEAMLSMREWRSTSTCGKRTEDLKMKEILHF